MAHITLSSNDCNVIAMALNRTITDGVKFRRDWNKVIVTEDYSHMYDFLDRFYENISKTSYFDVWYKKTSDTRYISYMLISSYFLAIA